MADQRSDVRGIAKEQVSRAAASASLSFNAVKPLVEFQASMMRLFAENVEQAASNYEKSFEAVNKLVEQSRREAA